MPFVQGFLKIRRRGKPGQPLPPGEDLVDPDYGIELPELPDQLPEVEPPEPPPGVWPSPEPGHPIVLPPGITIPPGAVWPPIPGTGKYVVAFAVIGNGVRKIHYTVVDGGTVWPEIPGREPKR